MNRIAMSILGAFALTIGALLFFISPGFGAPAFVQANGEDAGSLSTDTLAYTSNVGAGSLLVAVARIGSGTDEITSMSDSRGNTWARAHKQADGAGHTQDVWYAYNSGAGANTVTINLSSSQSLRWGVYEASGFTSASVDVSTGALGSSASPASGSVTPSFSDALAIAVADVNNNEDFTATAPFTERLEIVQKFAIADYVIPTPASTNSQWTLSISDNWGASLIVFAGSGGGGGGSTGSITTTPGTGSITTTPGTGSITTTP